MGKHLFYTDPFEVSKSLLEVTKYILSSEVKNFVESECPSNHIFIDAVIAGELLLTEPGSLLYNIGKLTEELMESFDESKSEELIDLVDKLYKYDINEL